MFLLLLPQIGDLQYCSLETLANYFFCASTNFGKDVVTATTFACLVPNSTNLTMTMGQCIATISTNSRSKIP